MKISFARENFASLVILFYYVFQKKKLSSLGEENLQRLNTKIVCIHILFTLSII